MKPLRRIGERSFAWRLDIARQISVIVDVAHREGLAHPHLDLDSVGIDDTDTVAVTGWRPARSPADVETDLRRLPELVREVLWPDGIRRRRRALQLGTGLPQAWVVRDRIWVETGAFVLFALSVAAVVVFGAAWTLTAAAVVLAVTMVGHRRHGRSEDE